MNDYEENGNGLSLQSALLGFAAGVIGTLLFATFKRREFDRVIGRARELSDRGGDLGDDLRHRAHDMVENLGNGAKREVRSAERATRGALADAESGVKEISGKIRSKLDDVTR